MKALIAIILVVVVGCDNADRISRLEKQTEELKAKVSNGSGSGNLTDTKPYNQIELHVTKVRLVTEDSGASTVFHVEAQSKRVEYQLECREVQNTASTCAHLEAGHDYVVDLFPDAGTVAFINRPLLKGEMEMPYVISSQSERR